MKKHYIVSFLCLFSILSFAQNYNPLLVVVLMVKNESNAMEETLQPYVDAGIDSFLIFDTGSTDNTIPTTQAFFEKNKVKHGVIEQELFIDFATSRNHAMMAAQKAFPNACFMLMPDAEWCLQNVPIMLEFCDQHKNESSLAYLVRIILGDNCDFYTSRLIRCNQNIKFEGAVHEVLNYVSRTTVPHDCYFKMTATRYGIEKSRKRWVRDCELLRKEHEKDPANIRTIFYLAQTYACLGDHHNAKKYYEKRCALQGWDEENFIAHYRLAQTHQTLNEWPQALEKYLQAFSMRPHRIEPLMQLAQYYWDIDQKPISFIFAQRACEIPYPHNDMLFVEKQQYEYGRYELLGRVAWYVQEYDLGKKALLKALEIHPDYNHLQKNLEFYTKLKNEH